MWNSCNIWSMECFSHFLFGEEFTLETNQKLLVRIYEKTMEHISPINTKLIYHSLVFRPFKVIYLGGKKNCYADALCRVSPILPRRGEEDTDIIMVNELTSVVPVPVNNLDEIRAEMAKDPVFMKIMVHVMQGWPRQQEQCQQRRAALLDPRYGDCSWRWDSAENEQNHHPSFAQTQHTPQYPWSTSRY